MSDDGSPTGTLPTRDEDSRGAHRGVYDRGREIDHRRRDPPPPSHGAPSLPLHRVLVTDADQRSSLAVVRSLGRAGYHVEVCSAAGAPLAGASRFCRASHVVADPERDVSRFVSDLCELVDARAIDVLLPMTDASTASALELRTRRPSVMIPVPPLDTWRGATDKVHLTTVARGLGVPVPRERVIHGPDPDVGSASAFAREVGFPVIVKPHRSAVVTPLRVMDFGVAGAADEEELAARIAGLPAEAFPVLVQERVQGPGLGGFFLARDGRILRTFAHRRLREKPPTGGVSVLRESVPLRPDLARHSAALLRHFDWSGVCMIEFKEDAASGTPYLMEINGRFWGSLQLAVDSGVDFPRALLDVFLDPSGASSGAASGAEARTGVRTRWLWGDVDHLLWILRAAPGYRDHHPELPGRLGAIGAFMKLWQPDLHYEVLRLSDPRPFLRESRQWLGHVLSRR